MTDLTPALVVVDSRNIFHQTDAATGFRLRPQVSGVVEAMKDYGFDALEVHVGLALPRTQDRADLPVAAAENGKYMSEVESADRGSVLLGELHRKDGRRGSVKVEEKQVDVACAVDICRYAALISRHESRFRAIVVLSQDTDMTPALKYAGEVGVPLVLAAHERVERRGFSYLLLTERAFRSMGQIKEPLAGHALRSMVARAVTGPELWCEWKIQGWDASRERLIVATADGLRGVTKEEHVGDRREGETVQLRVAGIDWGRRRNDFPLLTCTAKRPSPGHDHRDDFHVAVVRRRRAVTEVEFEAPVGGKKRLTYPPGGFVSRSEVVVDVLEPKRPLLVGPLQVHPSRDVMQAKPICVTPFERAKEATTVGKAGSSRVLIAHSPTDPPVLGARYAAVLVESGGGRPIVKLVSSALP